LDSVFYLFGSYLFQKQGKLSKIFKRSFHQTYHFVAFPTIKTRTRYTWSIEYLAKPSCISFVADTIKRIVTINTSRIGTTAIVSTVIDIISAVYTGESRVTRTTVTSDQVFTLTIFTWVCQALVYVITTVFACEAVGTNAFEVGLQVDALAIVFARIL